MTEPEREELAELRNRLTMLEGFVNYHWGEPWRKWLTAFELCNDKRRLAGEPLGEKELTNESLESESVAEAG